jgi:pimeloyl-ACP methyl ester carboxylesterase
VWRASQRAGLAIGILVPMARTLVVTLILCLCPAASAQEIVLAPPVDGGIARGFDQPDSRWGPGHRGIDYSVALDSEVRAAADGTVVFAGSVAGRLAVTIDHGSGLETTYSELGAVNVAVGRLVSEGEWIGRTARSHSGIEGMHFGVKLHGSYVDPEAFLGPVDTAGAIRLAPLAWSLPSSLPAAFASAIRPGAGDHAEECIEIAPRLPSSAPNDNIAVAIAGLGSKTANGVAADMYEYGPEYLGYPDDRIYRFSYRGMNGAGLHDPYERTDTYGDLKLAARRLQRLLERVALENPAASVDLIAHSQGGLVARYLLARIARAWDPRLPRLEHLVTFSTPHEGAPIADAIDDLETETLTGGFVLDRMSDWAQGGGPLPDPRSVAVGQLKPGSSFLNETAREDILFGTRALSLGILNDLVVPPDRIGLRGELQRVVTPTGLNGHSGILLSAHARALAHAFLRDSGEVCPGSADAWAGPVGFVIGFAEGKLGWAYSKLESAALRGVGRILRGRR